jgi:hypothetical protein
MSEAAWALFIVVLLVVPNPLWYNVCLFNVFHKFLVKVFRMTARPIDQGTCTENLLLFDDIMKRLGIEYWLSEGTALGAVRGGAFIPWDDDVDVGMHEDQRPKFIREALPELERHGFKLCYVGLAGGYFTFFRGNEALDVDIVQKGRECRACRTVWAKCNTCDEMVPFLSGNLRTVNFLGRQFVVPGDSYLEYLYGPTWRTPQKQRIVEKIKQL